MDSGEEIRPPPSWRPGTQLLAYLHEHKYLCTLLLLLKIVSLITWECLSSIAKKTYLNLKLFINTGKYNNKYNHIINEFIWNLNQGWIWIFMLCQPKNDDDFGWTFSILTNNFELSICNGTSESRPAVLFFITPVSRQVLLDLNRVFYLSRASVNQLVTLPAQRNMFASCSDDGTVRLWDASRLSGQAYVNKWELDKHIPAYIRLTHRPRILSKWDMGWAVVLTQYWKVRIGKQRDTKQSL